MMNMYKKTRLADNVFIEVQGLSKKFRLQSRPRVMLNIFLSAGAKREDVLVALNDINISVARGEVIGLIGRNGSGKSTLLKILAGLHSKNAGSVSISGQSLYLSGLNFASNPYMTVRENIYLTGMIFGLRQKEISAKLPGILDFSGLARFVDTETFKLSSGMMVRLNTSVAFYCMEHTKPDTLLLDEIVSTGGDIEFQIKSIEKIKKLVRGGATVLVASHDLSFIENFCDRVIWLESGQIFREGLPPKVVNEYKAKYGV